jgi:hypothetical protein
MNIFATLGTIINTAYILYCFALGIWAGFIAVRGGTLGGQFWGAMWMSSILAIVSLLLWLGRSLSGEQLRSVYLLYILFFIIVLPGTFALLRGRDDRVAAGIFSAIAIFAALSAISAADPTRHVIAPLSATPSPNAVITVTPATVPADAATSATANP